MHTKFLLLGSVFLGALAAAAGDARATERKLEVSLDSEMWGGIWLGQGDTYFAYGKAGWIFDIIDWGRTAIAFDVAYVENEARAGDEAWSYGGFLVQKIDWVGTELYAGVRIYEVEHAAPVLVAGTNFLAVPSTDPNAAVGVMTGARII